MTIDTVGRRFSYSGDGATTIFSFPRPFVEQTDLKVYLVDNVTFAATLQTLNTHYTVTGEGNPAGGSVTMLAAPTGAQKLAIFADTPKTHDADLSVSVGFPYLEMENVVDRLNTMLQELSDRADHAVAAPRQRIGTFDYTFPIPVAGKALGVNSGGTALEFITASGGGGGGVGSWGSITGTLSAQTDLQAALDAKAASSHTHTFASLTSKPTTLGGFGITDAQPLDADLTALAALTTNAAGRGVLTLADPNADRIAFWDDSAGVFEWLTLGTNLSITGTTLNASGGGGVAWGAITGTLSDQTDLQSALDAKAPLASPALTGNPTTPTPTAGDNDTSIANTAFVTDAVSTAVAAIRNGVGAAFDTLAEIATELALKLNASAVSAFGLTLIDDADAAAARTTLGLGTLATQSGTFSGASSGTNTGDQTSIAGITGTKAQFDTAVTDGNILYVGDVTQYTDELAQDAVGAMVDASLTYVDATPLLQRAALTGAITASAGSNTTALGSFTMAQLNAAVSDADVANATHTHVLANISDVTMTVANLNALDDGVNTALHFHDTDRARANHTGTQLAATVSDFNEAAQDAIGAMLNSTLVYTDATPLLERAAITGHVSVPAGSNAAVLGSFTMAQLDAAVSDGNVSYVGHTHSGLAPAGGTAGQVLKKIDGTDYNYSWQADDTGGGGGVSDGDKGDVVVSGSGTVWSLDINGQTAVNPDYLDELIFGDVSDSNNRKKTTIENFERQLRRNQWKWGYHYFSDFTGALTTAVGELGITNSGAGAALSTAAAAATNRPGIVRHTTGTTATGRSALASAPGVMRLAGGEVVFEAAVNIPTLSNGTERYQLVIGLFDTVTAANQVDAVAFVYDEGGVSAGSVASANWQAVTANNSTRTWNAGASGSSAVTAAQWDKLKIVVNADGTSVDFFVNDILRYTHTTNIPTAAGRELGFGWLLIKSVGTTARTVDFDYVMCDIDFTTAR